MEAPIIVPAVTHPTLCYQTPPLVGPRTPMIHCTHLKDHAGPHTWEHDYSGTAK